MPTQIPPRPQNYLLYSDPEDAFLEDGGNNGDGEYPEDWVKEMSRPDTPPNIKLPPGKQWSFVAPYKVTVPGQDEYGNPTPKTVYLFWKPVDIKEAKPSVSVNQPQPDQRSDITAKGRNFSYYVPAKLDPTTNRYVWDEEAGQKERARISAMVDAVPEPELNLHFVRQGDYLVGINPKTGTVVSRDAIPRSGQELEAKTRQEQQDLIAAVARARQAEERRLEREAGIQATRAGSLREAIQAGFPIEELLRSRELGVSPFVANLTAQERASYRPMQPTSWTQGVSPFQGYLAGVPGLEQATGPRETGPGERRPYNAPIQAAWLTPEATLAYKQKLLTAGYSADDVDVIWKQMLKQSMKSPMLASMTNSAERVAPGTGYVWPGEPGIYKPPGVGISPGMSPTEQAPFLQQLASINTRREQERMQAEEEERKRIKERYYPAWSAQESRRRAFSQR